MSISDYVNAGISLIPTCTNKLPDLKLLPNHKWDYFQNNLPSARDIKFWLKHAQAFAVICGRVSGNLEVIDIDNHHNNASATFYNYKNIILDHLPDLWNKLYIETSQSGGFHLIYRHSGTVQGSRKLAMQMVGDQQDTLIETRGEGGYVLTYPSPGYTPLQGSLTSLIPISADERDFLLDAARSFNKIPLNTVTHKIKYANNKNITRPGDVFNKYGDHADILTKAGWSLVASKNGIEFWRRPGKIKGISATFNYIPNKLYVFSSNANPFDLNHSYDKFAIYTQIKCNGDFKIAASKIKHDYPNLFLSNKNNNGVVNNINAKYPHNVIFWSEVNDAKGKPKIILNKSKLLEFLEFNGFGKLWLDINVSRFIKVKDHIVTNETPETIIDFVIKFLHNLPDDPATDSFTKHDILEAFLTNISKFKSKDYLETIKQYNIDFIRDTADAAFFFFENSIVEVSKNDIILHDYNVANGFVWKEQIIPHSFHILDPASASDTSNCVFGCFLEKVCSPVNMDYPNDRHKRLVDSKRLESLITAIGYLLHTYQNPTLTKAIIFCEEKISRDDEANGRTGKGLTAYAISKLRKRVVYNGKQVDFNDKFFYQKISPDTQFVYFDDVKKNFDFEALFSFLTEGFAIEYKGMKPIDVPFDKTPKVLISTNSVLTNDSDSHRARKFEIEFSDYFTADYTPIDEFGARLFEHGWERNDPEWDRFYNFMLHCVKHYLNNSLIPYTPINLSQRKLIALMPEEFIEFSDTLYDKMLKGERIYRNKIYEDFVAEYKFYGQNSKFAVSQRATTKWFNFYLKVNNIDYIETRSTINGERVRYWILSKYYKYNILTLNEGNNEGNNEF